MAMASYRWWIPILVISAIGMCFLTARTLAGLDSRQQAVRVGATPVSAVSPAVAEALQQAQYYTVCNGLTNQMLGHAGNIALAIRSQKTVMIPDVFIVDGTQTIPDGAVLRNTMPRPENSVPLGAVFNVDALVERIEAFGIEAKVVPYEANIHDRLDCSWLDSLKAARSDVVKNILKAMVPSKNATVLLNSIQADIVASVPGKVGLYAANDEPLAAGAAYSPSLSGAVCVHHRDGQDWHRHCDQWEGLSKANRNCRSRQPLSELVWNRVSHLKNTWLFYVGDHDIPDDLKSLDMPVVTRARATSGASSDLALLFAGKTFKSGHRDLGALLDFFMCSRMPLFVGNSVSTFSASQILLRDTAAAWYNSMFVPLASFVEAYYVPVVYTYTEESSPAGKLLLQASIQSVQKHMPTCSIHILYHGKEDAHFRGWLLNLGVVLHEHEPKWRHHIERMRLAGNRLASHLYGSAGNYLGTWQRIDIPLFLSAEYCILLDSDVVVVRPFTLADLGRWIPKGIAFSSELNEDDGKPSNAGVALMNVPYLRETREKFLEFVFSHDQPDFAKGPSDQGAYLEFYGDEVKFLSTRFNMKPYYRNKEEWENRYIIHFHGLKPNEHIQYWFSGTCEPLKCYLIFRFQDSPYQCASMQEFARAATFRGPDIAKQYCEMTLASHSILCTELLLTLAGSKSSAGAMCTDYARAAILQKGMNPEDFPYIK